MFLNCIKFENLFVDAVINVGIQMELCVLSAILGFHLKLEVDFGS